MLDELKREFPDLQPDNEITAKTLRESLERIVGTFILDGNYPGATVTLDGQSAGTMPQARPLRIPIGMHSVKVEHSGCDPLETTFMVLPKENARVAVSLSCGRKEGAIHPKEAIAKQSFRLNAAFGISPSLGGKVTDYCADNCGGGPGVGMMFMAGYRHRLVAPVHLGAIAGYMFSWQNRTRIGNIVSIEGTQRFADVNDDLFMHAFFAAPQISTLFYVGENRFDIGFALGIIGGPLVNLREARNGRLSSSGAGA